MKIACLDFETANQSRASLCAAGLAVFHDHELVESSHWLVRPPRGHGWFIPEWTETLHGLSWFDVKDAPEFAGIAVPLLERLATADLVIAHNAAFDMRVLRITLDHFQLPAPDFHYLCTLRLARKVWPDLPAHSLNALARHIGHDFQHHHARSDAEAAGRILLSMMADANVRSPADLLQKHNLQPQRFEA